MKADDGGEPIDPSWSAVTDRLNDEVDPEGFLRVLGQVGARAMQHPDQVASALMKWSAGAMRVGQASLGAPWGLGAPSEESKPASKDRRFSDPAWEKVPAYAMLRGFYELQRTLLFDLVAAADLPEAKRAKAEFAAGLLLDSLAPTNTLLGNPAAMREAVETKGESLAKGAKNFLDDVVNNGGRPRQVDSEPFEVGVNMAMTPGKVVYRSDLIELIQYDPSTPEVYETPLLFCPPWINKYYIMDLVPGKSLIEWARDHGHTCFAISYRNPDKSMADTSFTDYMFKGPLDAVRVVREITGARRVNTVSVCLGGTLTAMAMAYEKAAGGKKSINSATLINTHTDFEIPGLLGAFTDEDTIEGLERRLAKKGYLEGAEMATTFDSLRANDLIFQYVANNWLMGKNPPAFDLLAWNADATRMPARMHTEYLRACFLENRFAQGDWIVDGKQLRPDKIKKDTFIVSAVDDHIVPWHSAYRSTKVLGGESTFVLSTSGHIAGIVAPPGGKAKHWTNVEQPDDPDKWLEGAELHDESWWLEWTRWASTRSGPLRAARAPGSATYPPICDAPGEYVKQRS